MFPASVSLLFVCLVRQGVTNEVEQKLLNNQKEVECNRFGPEDLHATTFSPLFKKRVEFLQSILTKTIDGLEQLQGKASTLPEHLKDQMGATFPSLKEEDTTIDQLRDMMNDMLEHTIRGQLRAWNRVVDTTGDILDPSRSPLAPKTLGDLKQELEGLEASLKESEESFAPLLNLLGSSLAELLYPMMKIMEGMVQMGGEMGVENLKSKVDNLMGKVLLRIVVHKIEGTTLNPTPLFGEIQGMTRSMTEHFSLLGRRIPLTEFWRAEWNRVVGKGENEEDTTEEDDEAEEDSLQGDDLDFVVALVQKSMKNITSK